MAKNEHVAVQKITLETIDQAINDWFDKTLDIHVEYPNGERKKVQVTFASGERWVTARQRKGIRDRNGVLILPLISIRRTSIEPTPNMQALGIETPSLTIAKQISGKTNNLMNLNKARSSALKSAADEVVYEVTTIPFPDRSIMTYEVIVQSQYITQTNSIMEKIFHMMDLQKSFVAYFDNPKRQPSVEPFESRKQINEGYVVGFMDSTHSTTGNFEEFTDQERIVRWTTTIRVPTTLQLDPEGTGPAIKVERTSFKVGFGSETICVLDSVEELDKIFGSKK